MEFSSKKDKANREKLRDILKRAQSINNHVTASPDVKMHAQHIEQLVVDLLVEN